MPPQSSSVQQTPPQSSSVQQTPPQSSSSVQQTLPQSSSSVQQTPPQSSSSVQQTPPQSSSVQQTPPQSSSVQQTPPQSSSCLWTLWILWILVDPVCGLQLRFQQHHHPGHPSEKTDTALCPHLHLSVDHQLPDRQAAVSEAGKILIHTCTISTGAPQVVFSPHCSSPSTPTTAPLKTPLSNSWSLQTIPQSSALIQDGDESAYRQEVKELAVWCSLNNLELNTLKTVEMIVDFRRNPPALPPLTIMNSTVTAVESFRFLGTTISQDLKWDTHIDSIVKKGQQRMYFLRQLKSSTCHRHTWHSLLCCYWVGSVLFYNCMVWVSQQIRYKKTAADC